MSKGPNAVRLLELAERGRAASPAHASAKTPRIAITPVECPECDGAAVNECMCRPACKPTCAISCMHCDRRFKKFPSGYVEEG